MRVRAHVVRGLDLALLEFDPDLTFAVIFAGADGTIYGRYGTRSSFEDAERDISLEGLAKAMRGALELHAHYPANKAALAGKTAPTPRYKTLLDYPWAQRHSDTFGHCAHCHHLQNAEQMTYRLAREPIPDKVLFPWPMPDVVGLTLDPKEKATVTRVAPDSPAQLAGFRAGDEIVSLAGQPILSIADVQWVLHSADEPVDIESVVARGGRELNLSLSLAQGWRRASDISWRTSTDMLRRLGLGQMSLEELSTDDRREAGLEADDLALRVRYVELRSPAMEAGFRRGDVVVSFDRQTRRMSEGEVLAHSLQSKMPGERIPVTVLRAGQRVHLSLAVE